MRSVSQPRNQIYTNFLNACRDTEMTVEDIVNLGHKVLRKAKIHHHFFGNFTLLQTAQNLVYFALQLPHEYTNPIYSKLPVSEVDAKKIMALFEKRIVERLPVEYITQEASYLGYSFFVNESVLVPRSVMNNRFQEFLDQMKWDNYRVLDLCTGSGCVGITLAMLNPKIKVDLVDISGKALEVAEINVKKHALQERVCCIQSDLFQNLENKYDLIISNPPYISSYEYKKIHPEFKNEPKLALESGWDGLDIIHRILAQAKDYLNPNGKLIAEVGVAAARRMKRRYPKARFKWMKYRKPNGKVALLAMDCIFECEAKDLPFHLKNKNYHLFYRIFDRLMDLF